MSEKEVTLPKLGESIVEATIVQWFKKEGDFVALDEPLLEVSTDKINSEIPSPFEGHLTKIVAHPDETVKVGELLATIGEKKEKTSTSEPKKESTSKFYSPAVLRLAKEHHISLDELQHIKGTGEKGRVTKKDIENYLADKKKTAQKASPVKESGATEKIKMTPLRKAIADTMVRSFYEAPHASLVTEIDLTQCMTYIAKNKESFFQKHQAKLSITSLFVQALTHAVQKFPLLNASLEDDHIVVKRFVNMGIAVSVEHGVMVPVIKHCETLSIDEIAKKIASLAIKAREEALAHDEVQDGTITLTNFGMTGTLMGIPIIRHPEVAIVGMGAVHRKVVALDDTTMAIRKCMHVSLTFDHRVIDGMYGCSFLAELKSFLEDEESFSSH